MQIRYRRTPLFVALLAACAAAHGAETADERAKRALEEAAALAALDATELDQVDVKATPVPRPASPKYTTILRDTPQTIIAVDKKQIEQQNLLSLRDVLSTLPGITFGAGEGGGGFGDSINLRGFSANTDIFVDGLRDSAQYSRTDPFNLDAVEAIYGANSVYSGAGSIGGSINLVTKKPEAVDFTRASAGIGTDGYQRLTLDGNRVVGDDIGLRLNLMGHRNDAPGREVEQFERWGLAPSVAFGIGSDTRVDLSYVHQEDDNIPQYGVPFFNGEPLPGVDDEQYFGYRNIDVQEIDVDGLTAVVDHVFDENLSIRNITRASRVDQVTIVDPPQGTFCLADGTDPATGLACANPGTYVPSGPRGNVRDTTNRYIGTQTDLTSRFATGSVEHALVTGFSLTSESYRLDGSSELRDANGAIVPFPRTSIFDPDDTWTGPVNRTLTSKQDGELDNQAIYAFDTAELGEHWLASAGVRYEHNEGSSTNYNVKLYTAPTSANPNPDNSNIGSINGAQAPAKNEDDLFSYRAGVAWKPVDEASIYVSYANSKTPSKTSVNGACVPTSTTGTANCNLDPETAENWEIGAKWDVNDGRLSLTASVFRNDRTNFRVADPGNPNNPSGQQTLDGEARVEGVMLGIGGLITDEWSVYATYSHLDSEILQGVSDFVSGNGQDYSKGDPLPQVPDDTLSFWTTYDVNSRWQVGYGATYQGEFTTNNHTAVFQTGDLTTVDAYWVHRAMVAFRATRDITLQLNLTNLFDEAYYTRVRNNNVATAPGRTSGWATPGDARSAQLTATWAF